MIDEPTEKLMQLMLELDDVRKVLEDCCGRVQISQIECIESSASSKPGVLLLNGLLHDLVQLTEWIQMAKRDNFENRP